METKRVQSEYYEDNFLKPDTMNGKLMIVLKKIFDMFHIELSETKLIGFLQFVKFGIVGFSNTVISYVLNVLVLLILRTRKVSWDFVAANVVAFALSVLWAFYWNNRFVFVIRDGEHRKMGRALVKTYLAYGFTGIFLNNLLSWLWISIFSISKYIAPLINLLISVPINFIINKFWAFKSQSET